MTRDFRKIIVVAIASSFVIEKTFAVKQSTIYMPIFVPMTGDEPRNGEACMAATNVAIKMFNLQDKYLPSHNVVPVYLNEGAQSTQAGRQIIEFQRRSAMYTANGSMIAPVIVGPIFTPGCKVLASIAHEINMVPIVLGCGAPTLTNNRKLYPNMFRIKSGSDLSVYAILHFIKSQGHWKEFAILTWAGNVFNYAISTFLQQEALKNNFTVPYFDVAADVDGKVMESIIQSNLRVIVYFVAENSMIVKFLCTTFKYGITGPKYLFILSYAGFTEPESFPERIPGNEGCTRDIIKTQLRYAKWAGSQWLATSDTRLNPLGYNLSTFESEYKNMLSNSSSKRPADEIKRYLCHDSAMHALLVLDSAERRLIERNMTLSDYSKKPKRIMLEVNRSAAGIEYQSLRAGAFKLTSRLEDDVDPQVIAQWDPRTGEVLEEFEVQLESIHANPYSMNDYILESRRPSMWMTKDGSPPLEKPKFYRSIIDTSNEFFYFILAVVVLMTATQICFIFILVIKSSFLSKHVIAFLAFGFLNLAATSFAIQTRNYTNVLCTVRAVLLSCGMALIQSFIWIRIHRLKATFRAVPGHRITMRSRASPNPRNRTATGGSKSSGPNHTHQRRLSSIPQSRLSVIKAASAMKPFKLRDVCRIVAIFVVPTIIICFAWNFSSPILGKTFDENPRFDINTDSIYMNTTHFCTSNHFIEWIMSLVALNAISVAMAAIQVYKLGKIPEAQGNNEFKCTRLNLTNVTSFMAGSLFLLAVLQSPVSQFMALSIVSILTSSTVSSAVFYYAVFP